MADDTLKSFLVSLGFKVDDDSWKRFERTVASASQPLGEDLMQLVSGL